MSVSLAIFAIQSQSSAQSLSAVFKAEASSYVESGQYANTNFGASPNLLVGNAATPPVGTEEWTYVKFDLSSYTGPIHSVTLELYGHHTGLNTSDTDTVYGVPDSSWTQAGITWNNKPALGSSLSSATITTVDQYYAFDVTSYFLTSSSASRVASFAVLPEMIPNGTVGPDIFQSIAGQPINNVNPPILIVNGVGE